MRNRGQWGEPGDAWGRWPGWYLSGAVLAVAWCAGAAGIAAAEDGAALFDAKCAACHSVGGGQKIGPDLAGVVARRGKDRAILAIVDPAKAGLSASMPKLGLTRSDAEAISVYLESKSTGSATTAAAAPPPAQAANEAEATPEQVGTGRMLFEGSMRFANGGPACNACHHVNNETVTGGGNLAADITLSYSRLGRQGLAAVIENTPFPVMQAAYEGKAIGPEEIRALTGFLQRVEKDHAAQKPVDYGWRMVFGGTGGIVVLAGFFSLVGRQRKKRSVNQDIYDRQVKSE